MFLLFRVLGEGICGHCCQEPAETNTQHRRKGYSSALERQEKLKKKKKYI